MKTHLLLLVPTLAAAAPLPFAVGTNTGGSGNSEGIYLSTFDPATGAISEAKLAAKYGNPGFLALHPDKPILYAIGRSEKHPRGSIAAFRRGEGSLEFLGEASAGGAGPCHLVVHPSGRTLAVANYGDGRTSTLPLDDAGLPGEPVSSIRIEGSGPNANRQEGPHAHGVYFSGDHLLVPDLGLDKTLVFKVDPAAAKIDPPEPSSWSSAPGAGPRHLALSPDGRHAYVVNELDNTVAACSFDKETGKLETLQTIGTLPEDWTGGGTTAEIEVHPNGRFVYASNRGHDSIAVFRRDPASGKLETVHIAPCGGRIPRHFAIAPGGEWLLCAHQESNTISALSLDPATGRLGEPRNTTAFPNPICILFLPPVD